MTDETQLKKRYASLSAQRDMHRPTVAKGLVIAAAAKPVPVALQPSDSLVPRSASEQLAFEARKKPPSARSRAIGNGLLKAVAFVWLVVREIFVMFWELLTKRRSGACWHPEKTHHDRHGQTRSSIDDTYSSPVYSHLPHNSHHHYYNQR